MATITPVQTLETGLTTTFASCDSGGDEFINTGKEVVIIKNDHGSASYNITVDAHIDASDTLTFIDVTYGTLSKSNVVKACAAGSVTVFGPFKPAGFNDSNAKVQITYSATPTDCKIAVIRVYE